MHAAITFDKRHAATAFAIGLLWFAADRRLAAQELGGFELPSLSQVVWNGPAPSFEALKGKTVIILVYASWCPHCNRWSGELFGQLKQAIEGKPVVLLAINADDRSSGVVGYLRKRDFFAPNIIHGYDPSMPGRLGFKSNLFNFVWIDHEGQVTGRGGAGSYVDADTKRFLLADRLERVDSLGSFRVILPDMPEELQAVLWPLELGRRADERELRSARQKLTPALQEAWDEAIGRYLSNQLDEIKGLAEGDIPDRIRAAELAQELASSFKLSDQGREAREMFMEINTDFDFRREMKAKELYDRAVNGGPRRDQMLESVGKRFAGTYFGDLASQGGPDAP